MTYAAFRDSIHEELKSRKEGKTWKELRQSLKLPYDRPCPNWVVRLEKEIGLVRKDRIGNALIWRIDRA